MARQSNSSSGGSSRPDRPSASGAGTRAGSKAGSSAAGRSGSRTGTRAGTAVGATGFTTAHGQAAPAAGQIASLPTHHKTRPMLVGLAIAGWATFAVEWVIVLVIIVGRTGGGPNVAGAYDQTPPPPRATTPAPRTTTPPTPTTTPRTTTPPRPTPSPPPAAANTDNPLLMSTPNALGMTLNAGHTAVLLDAVDKSSDWFDDGKAALTAGLTKNASGQTVSLFTIRDGVIGEFNGNPFAPGPARRTPLNQFLDPLDTKGSSGLGNGVDAAVGSGAKEIIFITSRSTNWSGYLSTLERKLQPSSGRVTFHVVQVGDASAELQAFVQGVNSGRYTRITPSQLKTWRAAAD